MQDTTGFRPVSHAKTTITELMIPSYANFGGKIHGGIILSLMDKVAYTCAAKHTGGYCVTASINVVDFLAPVEVGDLVHLHASINYVGSSSVVVGVRVEAENVKTGEVRHTNSSYFTMVAVDEGRQPRQVPGLILENEQDLYRFAKTLKRRELLAEYKADVKSHLADMDLSNPDDLLTGHRCVLVKN